MVLSRIQETIEEHLSEEQCGFRSSRGTTDAIFNVRQVLEKANERHISIHWNFVDFKAAFDTVWREAFKCLLSIGVENNLIDLTKYMYDQTKCAVIVNGKVTERFQIMTGVRQGCPLSPNLFNIFLEFVMADVKNLDSGVQMGGIRNNTIRYADDTTLLELIYDKLQTSWWKSVLNEE